MRPLEDKLDDAAAAHCGGVQQELRGMRQRLAAVEAAAEGAVERAAAGGGQAVLDRLEQLEAESRKAAERLGALRSHVDDVDAKFNAAGAALQQQLAACATKEELAAGLGAAQRESRAFIAAVVQSVPVPAGLDVVKGALSRTLVLQFFCARSEPGRCLFPAGRRAFQLHASEPVQWLRVLVSMAQLGVAVAGAVASGGVGMLGVLGRLEAVWASLKPDATAAAGGPPGDVRSLLEALRSTGPFVSSADRDRLVGQLADARFFAAFSYDAQADGGGGWHCCGCARAAPVEESVLAGKRLAAEGLPPPPPSSLAGPFRVCVRGKAADEVPAQLQITRPSRAASGAVVGAAAASAGAGTPAELTLTIPKTPRFPLFSAKDEVIHLSLVDVSAVILGGIAAPASVPGASPPATPPTPASAALSSRTLTIVSQRIVLCLCATDEAEAATIAVRVLAACADAVAAPANASAEDEQLRARLMNVRNQLLL